MHQRCFFMSDMHVSLQAPENPKHLPSHCSLCFAISGFLLFVSHFLCYACSPCENRHVCCHWKPKQHNSPCLFWTKTYWLVRCFSCVIYSLKHSERLRPFCSIVPLHLSRCLFHFALIPAQHSQGHSDMMMLSSPFVCFPCMRRIK